MLDFDVMYLAVSTASENLMCKGQVSFFSVKSCLWLPCEMRETFPLSTATCMTIIIISLCNHADPDPFAFVEFMSLQTEDARDDTMHTNGEV